MNQRIHTPLWSALFFVCAFSASAADRPNIVWISLEDITPMMGCYGDKYARTPVFDGLAAEGIRYTKAHSIAPVCSTSRSSIITGMYPSSLGTHHHRSNVGHPPAFVKMLPNLMREAGYYTTNNAKKDYNIGGDRWHESSKKAHWRNRPDNEQPFFAVFNYGACHSSITKISEDVIVQQRLNRLQPEDFHDPAKAPIPPYHPDVPEFRKAWSRYYDAVTQVDYQAGELIEQLKADGLWENTIIFVWVGAENGLLLRSIHQALQAVDRDRMPAASLDPADGRDVLLPLPQPPEGTTPDRNEVITCLGDGEAVELEPGVVVEALVGDFNTARDLMTGIVTMQPEALLNYHTHPCGESITVLEGEAEISVEGRTYRLGPLDNITIPRWLPHQARNPDSGNMACLHVALGMSVPEREPVARSFDRIEMPSDSDGTPGFERVTRFSAADRLQGVGPGAEFIDYFNASLIPGIEMSGGFARFDPGGRLPDHLHDFDESICTIRGDARCLVEGRHYSLSNCATAMVPRGRVHYFINESEHQMDMIWVYAGPMPERIVIAPGFVRE